MNGTAMLTQKVLRELPVIGNVDKAQAQRASVPRTILLVEDNDGLREVMGVFLALNGFAVVSYGNAHLAVEAFYRGPSIPDLLLTDIEMPGMTGIELARELTSRRPLLPVIIVSGTWISPEASDEFRSRGWNFFSKPVGLPAILNAIELLLPDDKESFPPPNSVIRSDAKPLRMETHA